MFKEQVFSKVIRISLFKSYGDSRSMTKNTTTKNSEKRNTNSSISNSNVSIVKFKKSKRLERTTFESDKSMCLVLN